MDKLCIASDCYLPRWDGVARVLDAVLPIVQKSFETSVVAPDFPGAFKSQIPITRIPLSNYKIGDFSIPSWKPSMVSQAIAPADMVWVHTMASVGYFAVKAAKKQNKPIVGYVHSIDWELVSKSMSSPLRRIARALAYHVVKSSYKKMDHIMVPTKEVQELLRHHHIDTPSTVVPLGVDTQKFTPIDKLKAKRDLGIEDVPVIGYVGRLAREKDVITLYRAYISLLKKHPDAKLLIVGDGLEDYVDKMKGRKGVMLVGNQNNVVPYLQAMDIFVMPSLLETTSLATLEAMSCGCVPITTRVGVLKGLIREKKNGMHFPKGNALVLALKLEWVLTHRGEQAQMAKAARASVLENHSWQVSADKMVEVLQHLHHSYPPNFSEKFDQNSANAK